MASRVPGKEFERKFIVRVDRLPKPALRDATRIEQGYLSLLPNQVRIRKMGAEYVVEIKGPDDMELELFRPDRAQGERLLRDVAPLVGAIISKDRRVIPAGFDGLRWEIDFFLGDNAPLVVAEIEMPTKDYPLEKHAWPDWIGPEVTKDPKFKNKNLSQKPFAKWPKAVQRKVLKHMGV